MKRLHELTPQQIEEWRKARLAWGQTIYGNRDLQRYNAVDVMEELLDCINILERFENRAKHQGFKTGFYDKNRLVGAINEAIIWLRSLDARLPDEMCTDENGGKRIWWPGPEGK
jgi:hypothetical protein